MKDYKHIHRQNPYQLPSDRDNEERILNWGTLIASVALILMLAFGFIG